MRRALLAVLPAAAELRARVLHRHASLRLLEEDDRGHRHEDDDAEEEDAEEADTLESKIVRQQRRARPTTMPAKMISEMPLPMPFSVISSPSQTRNIVPAVIEMTAASVGSAFEPVRLMPPTAPRLLQDQQLAVALDERHRHGQVVRVELDLVAAGLALSRERLSGWGSAASGSA